MRAVLLGAAAALLALPAGAAMEDVVGVGPRAVALGNAYTARPGDFASAYHNPAGLSPGGAPQRGGHLELSLSLVLQQPFLSVVRDGGGEVPTTPVLPTEGALLGGRFSLGQPFHVDGLDAGFALYLPRRLFQWNIAPDDDPQWLMYGYRSSVVSLHSGVSYRVAPWLSLGAGVRMLFDVETHIIGRVTTVESEDGVIRAGTRLGPEARVVGRGSPLAGILLTPTEALRVGVSWRHESYIDDFGYTRITGVPGLGNLGYSHHYAHYYQPTEVTLGVGVDATSRWDVSLDVTWQDWSRGLSTNRNDLNPGTFGDTVTVAAGVRHRPDEALSLMAGYRFQPSPVFNFGSPANVLDNPRHITSQGVELALDGWLGAPGLSVSAALQQHWLVPRYETKDWRKFRSDAAWQANPGYPGYGYGGWALGGELGVEARW